MKKLKMGFIGWTFKDEGPECTTVAFCDTNEQKLEGLAKQHPDVTMYTDYRKMTKHPGLDAVVISTPNFVHAEQAIAFLDAGKHVFLEKPMGVNREECDRIIEAQARSGTNLTIDFEMRISPFACRIKQMIDSREYGRLLRMEFIHHRGGWLEQGNGIWRTRPEKSGGLYFMEPIHEVDVFRLLAGEVKWVQSTVGPNGMPQYRFEDNVCSHFCFENGVMGMIYTTHDHSAVPRHDGEWSNTADYMRSMGHDMSMIFTFETASIGVDFITAQLMINRFEEWPAGSGGFRVIHERTEDYGTGSGFGAFFHDITAMRWEFIRRCAAGKPPVQDPLNFWRTHMVCLAAEQSVKEDFRRVEVDYTLPKKLKARAAR